MSQIFTLGPVLVYFHAVFYDYFVLFLPDPLADCPVIAVVKCNPSAVTPGLAASPPWHDGLGLPASTHWCPSPSCEGLAVVAATPDARHCCCCPAQRGERWPGAMPHHWGRPEGGPWPVGGRDWAWSRRGKTPWFMFLWRSSPRSFAARR